MPTQPIPIRYCSQHIQHLALTMKSISNGLSTLKKIIVVLNAVVHRSYLDSMDAHFSLLYMVNMLACFVKLES